MHRIAFDPALPVVAAQPFTARGQKFASGARVDWRALGVTEQMLYEWWISHLVVHPLDARAAQVREAIGDKERDVVIGRKRKRRAPDLDSLSDDELERLTRPE